MSRFSDALNEQIGREFGASQQYIAVAAWYDARTLPQLAARFYRQAVEERNHAMMMVQYLLDADHEVRIPGVAEPQRDFADPVAPARLAHEQEKEVTQQIIDLVGIARDENDLLGEQFLHWFLEEQREEVASASHLVDVLERATNDLLLVESYLVQTTVSAAEPSTAPAAAGGEL
jgi:bacterioferritin B